MTTQSILYDKDGNPTEDESEPTTDSWVVGPALKIIGQFEASLKRYPLIPMGTPDPYRPPKATRASA